jgi:hypothetical protein
MTDHPGPPDGMERRRERQTDLAQAMADVVELQESVTTLAGAVSKIIPEQVGLGVDAIKVLLTKFAIMLGVFFVLLMIANQLFVAHIVSEGHEDRNQIIDVNTCIHAKAAAGTAFDDAQIACEEQYR